MPKRIEIPKKSGLAAEIVRETACYVVERVEDCVGNTYAKLALAVAPFLGKFMGSKEQ